MSISTHILDASKGRPAPQVRVILKQASADGYMIIDEQQTNEDGRVSQFKADGLAAGDYQLEFLISAYFSDAGIDCFYPRVCIDFTIKEATEHFHVPLLISPFSYSTYRGC